MTLAQLNYFVKVAENGHLTQTAKELLIAQPSLTQAIRKLEEELGFLLFEKKGRALFLTKEGKEFLPQKKLWKLLKKQSRRRNIFIRDIQEIFDLHIQDQCRLIIFPIF